MKSMKSFDEKTSHFDDMSDSDDNSNAVESRNKEMHTFEPNDHMEPFEESEYTNETGHEEYEGEAAGRSKL